MLILLTISFRVRSLKCCIHPLLHPPAAWIALQVQQPLYTRSKPNTLNKRIPIIVVFSLDDLFLIESETI